MKKAKQFESFLREMQRRGTVVMGVDSCMCADCVARRKSGDIRGPVKDLSKIAELMPQGMKLPDSPQGVSVVRLDKEDIDKLIEMGNKHYGLGEEE